MIKKENKLIQITLDPEHQELLNSLASRFHCSKTDIIKQALKVFAGEKNHRLTTYYTSKPISSKPISSEEWNKLFNENEEQTKTEETKEDNDLPF